MELLRRRHGVRCGGLVSLGMQARLCNKPETRDRQAHSAGAACKDLETSVHSARSWGFGAIEIVLRWGRESCMGATVASPYRNDTNFGFSHYVGRP
jgi:hypothetical protein